MKKIFPIVLILFVLLSCAACGGSGAAGSFGAKDISLRVNGQAVTSELSPEAILGLLGDGYDYAEAVSCVYEGMDKTYTYPEAVLYTYSDAEGEHLMELYCSGGDVKTSRGIGLGASREDVVAAYGEPTSEFGITLSYELEAEGDMIPASLYFELRGGTVTAISIVAEHRGE